MGEVDTDGDGIDEVVYGGRGVALVDDRTFVTGRPRWAFKWDDDPDNVLTGGDNMWTTGIEVLDATGDGAPDVLLTSSDRAAYLLDGPTGEKVWRASTGAGLSNGFALVDADHDGVPDVFPSGSRTVLSGRTGEELWEAPIPKNARSAVTGDFDGDGRRDVLITIHPPGAGTNPDTIVPALTATTVFVVSSEGELLYDFAPYNGIEAMAAADVDGDGVDEAVLGTFNGFLHVLTPEGIRWSSSLGPSAITALQVTDVDGDGRDEIFAGTAHGAAGLGPVFEVASFGPEGGLRWRHVVQDPVKEMRLADLDDDPALELLVGGGTKGGAPFGSALALETGLVEPQREIWRVEAFQQVESFGVMDGPNGRSVAIGSSDAILRVVDAAEGTEQGSWAAGGYSESVSTADLDGDGRDDSFTGNAAGQLIVTDPDGDEVWARKVPGGNRMTVAHVSSGDIDGDGVPEVGAAAEIFDRDESGQVAVYSSAGELIWSQPVTGFAQDVRFVDLDADGRDDVVVAEGGAALGDPCAVGGYDGRTGERVWWIELPTCILIHMDVDDVDGDGSPEIGFGTQILFGTPQVGLLETDGSVVWHLHPPQASAWLDLQPGTFVHGGFADQSRGHITSRDIDSGEVVWLSFITGDRGNGGGANRHGILVPDRTGDGVDDIVTSSDSREVYLVDGSSGETVWATRIQPAEVPVTHAHQSGPVVYVEPGAAEPLIFAPQYSTGRQRSETFVLSLAGEILDRFWMEGDAHAAAPARFSGDTWGAVVAAGLGTYAYEVEPPDSSVPAPTELILEVLGKGKTRELHVGLTSEGLPVVDRQVHITGDGDPIGAVTTAEDGTASMPLPPRYRGGHHTFEAHFDGDDIYAPATARTST